MKLILSTSNIMTSSPSTFRRPTFEKSNTELTSSLRANFTSHQQQFPSPSTQSTCCSFTTTATTNGITSAKSKPSFRTWTTQQENTLYIPTHTPSPLTEPRESYDITVKLFYLPNIPSSRRSIQTHEAINLVLRELGTSSIDLLIVSFPGISFDADDEDSDSEFENTTNSSQTNTIVDSEKPQQQQQDGINRIGVTAAAAGDDCPEFEALPEDIATMLTTWRTLESLHSSKLVSKLGISEFGQHRLSKFLPNTKVKPVVDQINVRDCCVVPKPLILYAKKEGVELLTHNDCTNVLPRGTLREILGSGEKGVGVLDGGDGDGLRGDVEPQWVVKYTAVVKDRGVVESKGYFAVAELRE